MGDSPPLDVFNFDISSDPRIIELQLPKEPPPPTKKNKTDERQTIKRLDTVIVNDSVVPVIIDVTPREQGIQFSNYESPDQIAEEDVMMEYINNMPIGPDEADSISFETYEILPPYVNDRNSEDFSIQYSGPHSPSIHLGDMSYGTSYGPSQDQMYNGNFHTVGQRFNPYIYRGEANISPSNHYITAISGPNIHLRQQNIDRSDTGATEFVSSGELDVSPYDGRIENGPISTPRAGLSYEEAPLEKLAMKELEHEIIETLFEIDRKSKNNKKEPKRRPQYSIPVMPRRRQRFNPRRPVPFTNPPNRRRKNQAPLRRFTPSLSRQRMKTYRSIPPKLRQKVKQNRVRTIPPLFFKNEGQDTGPRYMRDQELMGADTREIIRNYNRRGPRNSEVHVPPPDFRYPKNAGSIQDIIDHMTTQDRSQLTSSTRPQKRIPRGYKLGNQNHVLRPTFVSPERSRIKTRNNRPKSKKSKKDKRPFSRPRYKLSAFSDDSYRNNGYEHETLEHVEFGDDLLFHHDGSFSVVSDEHPRISGSRGDKYTTPTPDEYNFATKPHGYHPHSSNDYEPPIYNMKSRKPFKVMLDVYPVGSYDKGKYKPKYKSRYTILDELDEEYRSTPKEEFHSPEPRYRDSHEDYSPESRYRNSHQDTDYDSRESYSSNSRGREDFPNQQTSRGVDYDSRESHGNAGSRFRAPDLHNVPGPYYTVGIDKPDFYPRYRKTEDRSASQPRTKTKTTSSSGVQKHTITLHINLLSKDPGDDPVHRRLVYLENH